MIDPDQEDTRDYKVVKSVKGYISIWLSHKEIPKGWYELGKEAKKDECLKLIKENCPENPDMKVYRKAHNMPEPEDIK